MSLEPGGYADKLGNRYEGRWVARQLLMVLQERIRTVTIEAVGDEEEGVDLWIEWPDGRRQAQQCKVENGPRPEWSLANLNARGVLHHAANQLGRTACTFGFVSSVPAVVLRDLSRSARDSAGDSEDYFRDQVVALGTHRRKGFDQFCHYLSLDPTQVADRAAILKNLALLLMQHIILLSASVVQAVRLALIRA